MTKDEALTLALEALEGADMIDCDMRDAINAIKEVLAQPERPWVGLTDEDLLTILGGELDSSDEAFLRFGRAVIVKLKEKNS